MVVFHLFIISTFPLAVPLEWNVLFAFAAIFLFVGTRRGTVSASPTSSSPLAARADRGWPAVLPRARQPATRPGVLPPSMRQYAGNWASARGPSSPGRSRKLNRVTRPHTNQVDQLEAMGYPPRSPRSRCSRRSAWRSMHSQGRGLFSLLINHVRRPRPGHRPRGRVRLQLDHRVQLRRRTPARRAADRAPSSGAANFEPGEFIVAWVESQPVHKKTSSTRSSTPPSASSSAAPTACSTGQPTRVAAERSDPVGDHLDPHRVEPYRGVTPTIVVGAEPNGLAAAVRLAPHGVTSRCSRRRRDRLGGRAPAS